ncbi:single-stranded DNA-binding protein [Pendulispora albinea]|uniref:Single-stranded DNA-binding protein n=1 Tax=Pendulispora albinea TaxID=2741071 RepID=A0ABZ2M032_9BACT
MNGFNRVHLLGNLAGDPELKTIPSGTSVLKLRIACSESYLDASSHRQERTEWVNVSVWGKRGEALAKILSKGDRVFVEGSLHTSSYEKEGEKRYFTEVNAREVVLNGARRSSDEPEQAPAPARRQSASRAAEPRRAPPAHADDYGRGFGGDGDVPF